MICPACKKDSLYIIASRPVGNKNMTYRRRVCADCGNRYTTYEIIVAGKTRMEPDIKGDVLSTLEKTANKLYEITTIGGKA